MTERMPIKEAKKKFIKRSFYCGVVAILVCWFMKLFGFDYFGLDIDNKFFNDMSNLFENNYWLQQVYYSITLYIQLLLMMSITHRKFDKDIVLWSLYLIPFGIVIRVINTIYSDNLGNLKALIEIIYLIIATSKFKISKIPRSIFCVLFVTIYQFISLQTRSMEIKSNNHGFVASQILNIDFYLLLYLHKEVSVMDGGTFIFFGFTAWIYRVAGFIVGLFTLHPIKKSREWYEKGKAKEDARKAKKALK